MENTFVLTAVAAGALALLLPVAHRRWQLSRAKHRSLAGHSRMAKRLARWVPAYHYGDTQAFACDGAPEDVVALRRTALTRLSNAFTERFPSTIAATQQAREGLSDLQFTGRYRIPFQYVGPFTQALPVGAFIKAAEGHRIQDLDGNWLLDLTGSYGVNLLGHDFYRACIAEAQMATALTGPVVLGAYHPCVPDNVRRLKAISGLDEVSFHMSGTEAVMQAVRLARYHTRKTHLVRFCGAYHGWWEDVQPGPGNPLPPRETHTLKDMDERSLKVLAGRNDIACVLVNPLQALHPNANAPSDGQLIGRRLQGGFDRQAYTDWLKRLREVCSRKGIVLIFDEVFVGFRLAPGGAQQYFGVQADMVTYGKTLGGGLPVGVVCGRAPLMRRWRDDRPADICLARGTFNAHPMVMAAMNAFLRRMDSPEIRALYRNLDATWDAHAERFNAALAEADVPVRVAHLQTIWTVQYIGVSRYHWMLQYYLRDEGLALSWVGTGRLIFTLEHKEADLNEVRDRFVNACRRMKADGWWWHDAQLTPASVARRLAREMVAARLR